MKIIDNELPDYIQALDRTMSLSKRQEDYSMNPSSTPTSTMNDLDLDKLFEISKVRDIFPDLEEGFVKVRSLLI